MERKKSTKDIEILIIPISKKFVGMPDRVLMINQKPYAKEYVSIPVR